MRGVESGGQRGIECDRLADNIWGAAEPAFPKIVLDNDNMITARNVFLASKETAQGRLYA